MLPSPSAAPLILGVLVGLVSSARDDQRKHDLQTLSMQPIENPRTNLQEVLGKPIRELGLKLEGSPIERFVHQLYEELHRKGLAKFRPACYLTDEWGCPSGEPVIGIPFYLANPDLASLEREFNDLEDTREIMMYLRHEAGHAFNYAYKL